MCKHCTTFNEYELNSRRNFLDNMMSGVAGLSALSLGGLPAMADDGDDRVKIGYLPITDATALLIAHAQGYFKDEGLDAPKPTLIRGWSPLIEGFVAKKFNLVHFLKPIPIWMRYKSNFPVKVMGWAHTNGSAMVVGRHTNIKDYADLGGKQVAIPYWYSVHNILLQQALKKSGITPVIQSASKPLKDNECNLQILPPPDMPIALASRKIDAYTVAEPFNALGELKAGARLIRFTGDIWKNHPCCVVSMHEADTINKKKWTQSVMNAIVRAQVDITNNPKEAAEIISRDGKGYLPAPKKVVEKAMVDYSDKNYTDVIKHKDWDINRIDFFGYPYPSATKKIVTDLKSTLVAGDRSFLDSLDPEFVAKDLVNYDYIKTAINKHVKNAPSFTRKEEFYL
ncbi:MAG: ABC transporter substrate-binding protein [Alphaproteobacteria bacterium]